MKKIQSIIVLSLSILLSACSLFSISKPDTRVILLPLQPSVERSKPRILEPISLANTSLNPMLRSNDLMILRKNTLTRLAGSVWSENLSTLFHYNLLASLRNNAYIPSLSDDTEGIIPKYTIQTSLLQWNIVIEGSKKYAVGEVYINILNKRRGVILAHHKWLIKKDLKDLSIVNISSTFQNILDTITIEVIDWIAVEINNMNSKSAK